MKFPVVVISVIRNNVASPKSAMKPSPISSFVLVKPLFFISIHYCILVV